jgi:peptide-methionine (S)-S-oxide reductase
MIFGRTKTELPDSEQALPGREARPFPVPATHAVLGTPLEGPIPDGFEVAVFGLGCFWGEEKMFWQLPGVWSTSVGYAAGITPNPTYEEVCTGRTGHAEAVEVEFDPARVSYEQLLDVFWREHDPTQLNRQGPDRGTQYRTAIYFHSPEQESAARASREREQSRHRKDIVTEITPATAFWPAEEYHQRYLEKRGLTTCAI